MRMKHNVTERSDELLALQYPAKHQRSFGESETAKAAVRDTWVGCRMLQEILAVTWYLKPLHFALDLVLVSILAIILHRSEARDSSPQEANLPGRRHLSYALENLS